MNLVLWVFIKNNSIDIDVNISGENGYDVDIKRHHSQGAIWKKDSH